MRSRPQYISRLGVNSAQAQVQESEPKEKLAMEMINKLLRTLMQLVWKVVRPEDLKLGDHIYRYGLYGLYSHHGIYVGNGFVIHFTRTQSKNTVFSSLSDSGHEQEVLPPCPKCEYQATIKRGVIKTCLDCFRRDGQRLRSLHRYDYGSPLLGFKLARRGTCTMLPATKSPHQVIETARELHANNAFGNYDLIDNNCEHFATFCRTDVLASKQTAFISDCEHKIVEAKEWTMKLLQGN